MITKYMAGSGIEQLLQFSGLSKSHQQTFHVWKHYRKNRWFLSQVAATHILLIEDVLRSMFPDVSSDIRNWIKEIEVEGSRIQGMPPQEREGFTSDTERGKSHSRTAAC